MFFSELTHAPGFLSAMLCPLGSETLVRLGVDLPLGLAAQEINTWISACLCRPRWLGLGHLDLEDASGFPQKEKLAARAQPRYHLLSRGSVSKAMLLYRDTQTPR